MFVKETNLWGMNVEDVLNYGKKYSIYSKCIIISSVLITLFVFRNMLVYGVIFGDYIRYMLLNFIVCSVALSMPLKEDKYKAYKFLLKYGKCEVLTDKFLVDSNMIYQCLYRIYRSRLKKNDSVENYMSLVNTVCKSNKIFAWKFMVNLFNCLDKVKPCDNIKKISITYFIVSDRRYFLRYDIVDEVV